MYTKKFLLKKIDLKKKYLNFIIEYQHYYKMWV
jgi:hypothetical protein